MIVECMRGGLQVQPSVQPEPGTLHGIMPIFPAPMDCVDKVISANTGLVRAV